MARVIRKHVEFPYLSDAVWQVNAASNRPTGDPSHEGADRVEDGPAEEVAAQVLGLLRPPRELYPLDVLLELPVVDKGALPLRNKLSFKLLRELHHFFRFFLLCMYLLICGVLSGM